MAVHILSSTPICCVMTRICLDPQVALRILAAHVMSQTSQKRSEEFLAISDQFKLGALTTESSHPVTAHLSQTAKEDVSAALKQLIDVYKDDLEYCRKFVA